MGAAKLQFQRDKQAVKDMLALTTTDAFQSLLIYAKAEFASRSPSTDAMQGANDFERILLNMPKEDVDIEEVPLLGITHDLSQVPIKRATPKTQPAK